MSSTATSEVSPGPEPPFPLIDPPRPFRESVEPSPHSTRLSRPPQALGPGSYEGAREHKSTRGAPFGTAKRDTGMVRPGRVPGPGAYGDWALSVTGVGAHRSAIGSGSKGFGGGPRLAPDASLASPGPGTYYDHGANLWIKRVGSGREGPSSRSRGSPHRTLSATTTSSSSSTARRAQRSNKTRHSPGAPPSSATPPSIPSRARSHGYVDPSPDATSRDAIPAPVPPGRVDAYAGVGDDRIGPDRYSPTRNAVDVSRCTDFASSRSRRAPVPDEPRRSPGARYLDEVTTRLAPMARAGGANERDATNAAAEHDDVDEKGFVDDEEAAGSPGTASSFVRGVPSTAGHAAVRRGSASESGRARRRSAQRPTPGPGEYAGAASSGFDRLRSPSRLERLGGSERGRRGMESARAHGRSSAWDDDIASPGGKGGEGAKGAKGATRPPPLAVDATGRLEDFAGDDRRTRRASSAMGRRSPLPQTGFGTSVRSSVSARAHSPGPGAYDAIVPASSPSPSSRKGTFGRSLAGETFSSPGADSPGPGSYDSPSGRKTPSSPSTRSHVVGGFVTAARRPRGAGVGGAGNDVASGFVRGWSAGDVSDSDNGAAPRTPNRGFGRQAARGSGDARVPDFPGPGAYDPEYGANDAWERRKRAGIDRATHARATLPKKQTLATSPAKSPSASPGPGHYDCVANWRGGAGGGRSGFRSGSERGGDPAFNSPSPGPGFYYPRDSIVRRSHNVTAR